MRWNQVLEMPHDRSPGDRPGRQETAIASRMAGRRRHRQDRRHAGAGRARLQQPALEPVRPLDRPRHHRLHLRPAAGRGIDFFLLVDILGDCPQNECKGKSIFLSVNDIAEGFSETPFQSRTYFLCKIKFNTNAKGKRKMVGCTGIA